MKHDKAAKALHAIRQFHHDQQGTISFLTVFAVLALVVLLGMVMNVGRSVDGKIRMQNAADSAAYSGGLVLARELNTLAFTNHLLGEVFALTAFLQEAQARNAESHVPSILAAWDQTAPALAASPFPKFQELAVAIPAKTPLELEMVRTYGDWVGAVVPNVLPVLESVLQQEAIPQFQRSVVSVYPSLAQAAAQELTELDGGEAAGRGTMVGALWRTKGLLVGGPGEYLDPSLPVIDPAINLPHQVTARNLRNELARHYLREWNKAMLEPFDRYGKMSQFANLWRSYTCANLEDLLGRFATTNLPMLLHDEPHRADDQLNSNAYLDEYFTFVGVVYWGGLPTMAPGVFQEPMTDANGEPADAVAFAQVRVYIPRRRLVYWSNAATAPQHPADPARASYGRAFHGDEQAGAPLNSGWPQWRVRREPGAGEDWSLLNQRWSAQLVPATSPHLMRILQTAPTLPEFERQGFRLPDLRALGMSDIAGINTH